MLRKSGERVLMKTAKYFEDVFTVVKNWSHPVGKGPKAVRYGTLRVGKFCTVERLVPGAGRERVGAFCVEPTLATLNALEGHVLALKNDELYFEVLVDGDETTVRVVHNTILGSDVLAVVKTDLSKLIRAIPA